MVATEIFSNFELDEVNDVNVLVVEQDEDYIEILRALLRSPNFNIVNAKNAQETFEKLKEDKFDLILLSAGMNGHAENASLLDEIRNVTVVPVIALIEPPDVDNGTSMMLQGADYDLQKPFTPRRLRAAVTAVLRRSELGGLENTDPILPETITTGGLSLSLGRLEAVVNDRKVSLSAREFSLLQFLMSNPNRTFTREELAMQAWGWAKGGEIRAVDSAIKRLRSKIETDTRNPRFIVTERNLGYRFNANGE